MPATISLTETQTMAALRTVILGIVPDIEVIRGQQNRVPEPLGPDFIIITAIMRNRLSTNIDTFTDLPLANPPVGTRNSLAPTQITVQIDVHGPASGENAQMISTLMRDEYACIEFARTGFDVQPLYADDPRETAFENGEQQTEERWSIDAVLQANPVIGTAQDFADTIAIAPILADHP